MLPVTADPVQNPIDDRLDALGSVLHTTLFDDGAIACDDDTWCTWVAQSIPISNSYDALMTTSEL